MEETLRTVLRQTKLVQQGRIMVTFEVDRKHIIVSDIFRRDKESQMEDRAWSRNNKLWCELLAIFDSDTRLVGYSVNFVTL